MDEPDIEYLIKELAKAGADPFWVAEAISAEQEAEAARSGAAAGSYRMQTAQPSRVRTPIRGNWPRMKASM
jgi:hypothetical protein